MTSTARRSPSALNRFLACEYRTYLDLLERRGEAPDQRRPPEMQLLLDRGERFERELVERLENEGRQVVSLDTRRASRADRVEGTLSAMRSGVDVIHQGCVMNEDWVGYPDFLMRIDDPSDLGDWSYEVYDAKLGTHARPAYVFQLLFYTDEVGRVQGMRPARMHLALGNGETASFRPEDFDAYATRVRAGFVAREDQLAAGAVPGYPYPVSECDFCPWWLFCKNKRRAEDHISLVANLRRGQGRLLELSDVHDIPALASLDESANIPKLNGAPLETLRSQADLQLRSRGLDRPLYELLEPSFERGLGRLPSPSTGDVYFDFEGDPNWGEEGLEYLFGTVFADDDGARQYWPLWAESRTDEKQALETWMDWIAARRDDYPELHIYHYNSYEPTALKRLVARHVTREAELDGLLRSKVFVDLYGVTRQALRAGVERYGLKGIEAVYGFERNPALKSAIGSLNNWDRYQLTHDPAVLEDIALYNKDDCLSTWELRDWLWAQRPVAAAQFGVRFEALAADPPHQPGPKQQTRLDHTEQLRQVLLAELPDDEANDDDDQRARRLMFTLTGFHAREAKPGW
jgi:uncharacterized protein